MDASARGKVLIVDDDEIVLVATEILLIGAGFTVALEKSAFNLNATIQKDPPDLILMDVRMPALNGDRAVSILKRYDFSRDIPVLLFSDLEVEELRAMVEETGAVGYVKKSWGSGHLLDQVRRLIRQPLASSP